MGKRVYCSLVVHYTVERLKTRKPPFPSSWAIKHAQKSARSDPQLDSILTVFWTLPTNMQSKVKAEEREIKWGRSLWTGNERRQRLDKNQRCNCQAAPLETLGSKFLLPWLSQTSSHSWFCLFLIEAEFAFYFSQTTLFPII